MLLRHPTLGPRGLASSRHASKRCNIAPIGLGLRIGPLRGRLLHQPRATQEPTESQPAKETPQQPATVASSPDKSTLGDSVLKEGSEQQSVAQTTTSSAPKTAPIEGEISGTPLSKFLPLGSTVAPIDPSIEAAEAALRGFARAAAEIFKLSIVLPLRYLVLAPLGWALTRLGVLAVNPKDVLNRLEAANASAKLDADKVAEVFSALNRHHPQAVVEFVESKGLLQGPVNEMREEGSNLVSRIKDNVGASSNNSASSSTSSGKSSSTITSSPGYAVNAAVVKEYMIALVRSGKIQSYTDVSEAATSSIGPTAGHSHRSLSQLLEEMKAASQGMPLPGSPGSTIARPLHVVIQGSPGTLLNNEPTGVLATLHSLFWFSITITLFSTAWILGALILRRVSAVNASMGTSGNSGSAAASVSPGSMLGNHKEYNKENMPEKSVKSFNDVKGCDEAITELQEIVEYLKSPDKFTRLGGKLPKGVLLTGAPGTGKTLLARAVAGEAGVPFFYKSGSEFDEMFVGVGSRRVRSLFAAAAKKAPCIVFIDEIDAVGGKRTTWESSGGSRKTLNQLLTDMDGFEENSGVVVMAATNLPDFLDPALTRPGRFDRQVAVPLPDVRGREQIINLYLAGKPMASDVDVESLARRTPGFSGAQLANLINEGALLAARNDADCISAALLDEARDKVLMGSPRSLAQSLDARRLTAYHEGGHALVALYTSGAKPIHKATIVPRGHALGMVSQIPDKDEYSTTKQQMMAHIEVAMGGKAAEELIFGEDYVTTGATSDLRTATRLARHMVEDCGMSERIGPMALLDNEGSISAGGEIRKTADEEVTKILKDAYKRVADLLKNKETELHSLAAALLEKETLTQREIKQLLWGIEAVEKEDADKLLAEGNEAVLARQSAGAESEATSTSAAANVAAPAAEGKEKP